MLALAAAAGVVAVAVAVQGGAPASMPALGVRLANALAACGLYVWKSLWPAGLSPLYPIAPAAWTQVAMAAIALVGISVLVVRTRRRHPYFVIGWCWFLVSLVPMLDLVPFDRQWFADRHAYLPQIGLAVMAAWGLGLVAATTWRRIAAVLVALVALAFLVRTSMGQVGFWREGFPLFRHTVAAAPGNPQARTLYGIELHVRGDRQGALEQYQAAYAIEPESFLTRSNLGLCLAEMGRLPEAVPHLEAAIRLDPLASDPHRYMAMAHAESGRYDQAEQELREALRLKPNDAIAYFLLGKLYVTRGEPDAALEAYDAALRIRPDYQVAQLAKQELMLNEVTRRVREAR